MLLFIACFVQIKAKSDLVFTKICASNQFQCNNGNCVPLTWVCDGVLDCVDGEDEEDQNCSFKTCASNEFQCNNGNCVPLPWVCDGEIDCVDGEDEEHQHCSDKRINACQKNEFSCRDGKCIPFSWVNWLCDGVADCVQNALDELDCSKGLTPM